MPRADDQTDSATTPGEPLGIIADALSRLRYGAIQLTNFRLGFRTEEGFNIYGWLRNAFDTEYFEQLAVPSGNTGLIVGQPGDQQTYGLTVAYRF